MAIYSIKDLEKLCGIKAHTIRIWEQRYDLIKPNRTDTNIRYYTDADLRLMLNVALLRKNGFRIAKIADMSQEEIHKKVSSISEASFEHDTQLDALTISMIEMDEYKFDRIINTNIKQLGFEQTMIEIVTPFLEKLSLLWLTGSINPAQEHFISCLIRQKIISAINQLSAETPGKGKVFLLFLPKGENQELGLLFLHYLLKKRKHRVIYLGQNIPLDDLEMVNTIHNPDYLFTMITATFRKESVQCYVDRLSDSFPRSKILLSGYQVIANELETKANTQILPSLDIAIEFLTRI